jgi:sugar phosphate permease
VDSAADNAAVGRAALAKATARLIPFLFLLYIVAFLDRVNVGFAALQMNEDLGFSDAVYGLGAGIFFIGYFIFEIPSNLILERVGARVWIARIMITWGIISAAMFFVTGPVSFYALRFLLGVAEAGFFPGMILYLTYWFPARERARRVALFMTAIPIAAVGLVLTGLVGASEFLEMAAITIAAFGIYSTLATFWSLPTAFLSGTAAAAGIALINSVGNLGGFVGPYVVGYLSDATGGFYAGLLLLAALILIAGLLALAVRHERSLEQVEEVVAPIAGTPTSG